MGKRKGERHESPEIGGAARRFIRSLTRRAGEGDFEALEQLVQTQRELQSAITEAGRLLHSGEQRHDGQGYSYTEIAAVLGITRQAARQRFATPNEGHNCAVLRTSDKVTP